MKNLITKTLTKAYCKRFAKRFSLNDTLTFYSDSKEYGVSFQGLSKLAQDKDWQDVNMQVFKCKENGEVENSAPKT